MITNQVRRNLVCPLTRTAVRTAAIRSTIPSMVVMSEAGLNPVKMAKLPAVNSPPPNWDQLLEQAKSPATKKFFEELKNDPTVSLNLPEVAPGTTNYEALLPRGGAAAMRNIEWGLLAEVITSDEGKKQLAEIKSVITEIQDWIKENDKPEPQIDWRTYHNELDQVLPGVVDQFKTYYEEAIASIPDVDLSQQIAQIKKQSEQLNVAVDKYCQELEEFRQELLRDHEALKNERSVPDMTTEEVLALYPGLAAEIEQEIAEGKWEA